MNFFVHETIHIALSLLAGFLAYKIFFVQNQNKNRLFLLLLIGFIAGVLVDLDHLFDYFIAFGPHFNLEYFIKGYQFLKLDKIYTPLHGFEYVVFFLIAILISKKKVIKSTFLAIALALFLHLVVDIFVNNLPPKTYSLIYRASKNFNLKDLVYPDHYQQDLIRKENLNF